MTTEDEVGSLVITMKQQDRILIDGKIWISLIRRPLGANIRLRIEAPKNVKILREKFVEEVNGNV